MEVKGILRRAQSLKTVSTDHSQTWTEAGLRDKSFRKSVSQLVAQYQNSPGSKTKTVHSGNINHEFSPQITQISVSDADGGPEISVKSSDFSERSRISPLSRSKSMESLPQRRPAGTTALRALFESKTQPLFRSKTLANEPVGFEKAHTLPIDNIASPTEAETNTSHDDKQDDMTEVDQMPLKDAKTYPETSLSERRKTFSGFYTDKRSFPEENKRRTVADFRDSSEISSISVKALSALYLSKVAAAESAGNLFKQEQDPNSPIGKRIKPVRMAEQNISKQTHPITNKKDDALELNPPKHHLEPSTEECERPFTSPPPTRETMSNIHQQRKKCELKRLLKHTCPELKNIDSLVDEEMADILNTDPDNDTGYQCEVQSRRWLFENQAINSADIHQIKGDFQDGDIKRTSWLSEEPNNEENKSQTIFQTQPNEEEVTSEQSIRVDVKATRRMFEIQSVDTLKDSQSLCPKRNFVSEEQNRSDQKPKNDSETSTFNNLNSDANFTDTSEVFVGVSKVKQIFENRSHDEENIYTSLDSLSKEEEMLKANVRNRAQMFESTPFDKINQQTKEESETMLENIQDTLISLWNFNVLETDGSILESNETGHVKKARYNLIKDSRPEVHDEEIVTGSIKNTMLQMLPGTNLNPIVTYLKEDSLGNVEIQKVYVPTHQLPFTVLQDKDCRIANVVEVTEELLGQEKSLRKGVLIQGATETREITVYALFSHSEENIGVFDVRSITSSQTKNLEPDKENLKMWDISSPIDLEANKTINMQLVGSCVEEEDLNHLKHLQKTLPDEDISASSEEREKTVEIIPGNVKNIKALFSTNLDRSLSLESAENKVLSVIKNKTNKTEEPMQTKDEQCCETNLNKETILQDIEDDGAVLQAELVDVVEDDELLNLQTAIMNLQQATMEAKALQQSVEAKLQTSSPTNQTQQISDPGSASHEVTEVKKDSKVIDNEEPSQISKTEQEEENEDVMRGSIQAALESLGKSNVNVTKGDFRAAMIYRNSGKAYAGHKKVIDVDQPSDKTVLKTTTKLAASGPQVEQQVLKGSAEGVDTASCQRPSKNKPLTKQMHVSTDAPQKTCKTSIGPKPAIPPKPDHLKMKPSPNANDTDANRINNKVIAPCSKPNEEIKEASSGPGPMSYKDVLCKNLEDSGDACQSEPCDTTVNIKVNDGQTQEKLNPTQVLEESSKSSEESETSVGLHATLQNFGAKAGGSVAPVKPKRIKMAKDHVKDSPENMNHSEVQHVDIMTQCNGSSSEDYKCDGQQKSEVIRREKKPRGETEDERRQRLSVHMDEIIKGNVTAVMEIFDNLKKQEELKNILSKVEEIEEDTNEVNVSSLKNIFESVPDWVVPQEEKTNPEIVMQEHRRAALGTPVEPEMMSSMQVAFGDLEKAGAEIINLKEQTLARLMDIEEAIKKALYSVSSLRSDSDIVGLSGLFRESMVEVQGSPTSGNIRKISIGSSKSPKAQNQNGQPTRPATFNSRPDLFIPTTKQRSTSPASPSFISIQSAARKPAEVPLPSTSQINPQKAETKVEAKHQCCCNASSDRRQCTVTKEISFSPGNQRRQVSVLEVKTAPEKERVLDTRTISENYERTDCFGNKFYSSKTSTVVTTQPETRRTSKKFITTSPTTSEIVTYPTINTPLIRDDQPSL
ncbi:xin actin-binding repeat-containing protein 1 isoform X1 [Misgurnus anguillicaudatus]|uniref:xin actin-binding repeat-containing protein 1 isoform X1 n=2 Tax=Misgurnus anguillicaudatus TaxID=75329 RepID=UPI003CCF10DC